MIVAQDSVHVPPVALANHTSVAQTSAPWRSPVQIHHLVVVAIPDPSQPAVDRVLAGATTIQCLHKHQATKALQYNPPEVAPFVSQMTDVPSTSARETYF
jgi:hypothetical protein